MNYSVTKNGVALDKALYKFDEKTKTFSSLENNLVLDFSNINGCTFDTGYGCTFKTGSDCTFKTGSGCTFDTGYGCTFDTGYGCTFDTGFCCTFDTGFCCTFKTGSDCTFKTGSGSVVIRRDIYEVIELKENEKIKLKGFVIKGFDILKEEIPAKKMTVSEISLALGYEIEILK